MLLPIGTVGKAARFPWVTIYIIILNILLFIPRSFLPQDIYWEWVRYVAKDTLYGRYFVSMFLHADFWHIFGNMIFLWSFGALLEDRMGRKKYLVFYILGGLTATIVQEIFNAIFYPEKNIYGIGASGAVSAAMGAFMVRFYFRKVVFVPYLAIPLPYKLRIHGLLFVGFFLVTELKNGIRMIDNPYFQIAHWAHLGGMFYGLAVAAGMGHFKEARIERMLGEATENFENNIGLDKAKKLALKVIELDSKNLEALYIIASISSKYRSTPAGDKWYRRAINAAFGSKKYFRAAQIYMKYLPKYEGVFPGYMQLKLTQEMVNLQKYNFAARGLEKWLETNQDDPTRPAVVLYLVRLYCSKIKAYEMAVKLLEDFIKEKPEQSWEQLAREKLNNLKNLHYKKQYNGLDGTAFHMPMNHT